MERSTYSAATCSVLASLRFECEIVGTTPSSGTMAARRAGRSTRGLGPMTHPTKLIQQPVEPLRSVPRPRRTSSARPRVRTPAPGRGTRRRFSVLVDGVARRVVGPGVTERRAVGGAGARERRGLGVDAQVVEDAPGHGGLGDEGDDLEAAGAGRTLEHADGEGDGDSEEFG